MHVMTETRGKITYERRAEGGWGGGGGCGGWLVGGRYSFELLCTLNLKSYMAHL